MKSPTVVELVALSGVSGTVVCGAALLSFRVISATITFGGNMDTRTDAADLGRSEVEMGAGIAESGDGAIALGPVVGKVTVGGGTPASMVVGVGTADLNPTIQGDHMLDLLAVVDGLVDRFANEKFISTRRLIDPLLSVWSEDLEPGTKDVLQTFLSRLPRCNLITNKELSEFAMELRAISLVSAG